MSWNFAHKMAGGALLVGTLGVGCAVDGSDVQFGSMSEDPQEVADLSELCPEGWMSDGYMKVDCPQGSMLEAAKFDGQDCVRCTAAISPIEANPQCTAPWMDAQLNFGCSDGHHMAYTRGGECKRCVKPAAECMTDEDCFRTGCSGEICDAEDVASICVWRPEFACYEDQHCGCRKGLCGWRHDPDLIECLTSSTD